MPLLVAMHSLSRTVPKDRLADGWDELETAALGTSAEPTVPRTAPKQDELKFVEPGALGFRGGLPGFVQVEFSQSDAVLGIIVDWSMALPVACGVVAGSAASVRPALAQSGGAGAALVLVKINGQDIHPGTEREHILELLGERPLILLFERARLAGKPLAPPPWRRWAAPAPGLASHTALGASEIRHLGAAGGAFSPGPALARSYIEEHPERSPLTRWGKFDLPAFTSSSFSAPFGGVAAPLGSTQLSLKALGQSLMLPRLQGGAHGSSPEARSLSRAWTGCDASDSALVFATGPGGVNAVGSRAPAPGARQIAKSASLTQLPASVPRDTVDKCYQQLSETACGAGLPAAWPLGHDARYICKLEDMRLVRRLWDAYEVGFRGRKRAAPTAEELIYGIFDPRQVTMTTVKADKTALDKLGEFPNGWCDACGKEIGDEYLWFCRRCKVRGNRFELCIECHAVEVLQAEGKQSCRSPHSHLLHCEHRSLVRQTNLRVAYPGLPHLRSLYCDVCGSGIPGLAGGDDRACTQGPHNNVLKKRSSDMDSGTRKEGGGRLVWKPPGTGCAFVCPRCPEEAGLRFDVCESCAHTLLELGSGIQRLAALF